MDLPLPAWVSASARRDTDEGIQRMFFYLSKELHISYVELLQMPVPAILSLSIQLSEWNKEQEREMKKVQRHR